MSFRCYFVNVHFLNHTALIHLFVLSNKADRPGDETLAHKTVLMIVKEVRDSLSRNTAQYAQYAQSHAIFWGG